MSFRRPRCMSPWPSETFSTLLLRRRARSRLRDALQNKSDAFGGRASRSAGRISWTRHLSLVGQEIGGLGRSSSPTRARNGSMRRSLPRLYRARSRWHGGRHRPQHPSQISPSYVAIGHIAALTGARLSCPARNKLSRRWRPTMLWSRVHGVLQDDRGGRSDEGRERHSPGSPPGRDAACWRDHDSGE